MDNPPLPKKRHLLFSFRAMSLRQRLSLLICILLVSTVLALGFLAELGVRKAAITMGKERLGTVTNQLTAMFAQSAVSIANTMKVAAAQEPFKKYIDSRSPGTDSIIVQALERIRPDTTWVLAELLDQHYNLIARSGPTDKTVSLDRKWALNGISLGPDSAVVGRFLGIGEHVYFPAVASVTINKQVKGYLICWRQQNATPAALGQLSQLLGTNASLYVGNIDGSVWTDMRQPVPAPPLPVSQQQQFFQYSRPGKDPVIASANAIPKTQWTILVEFSQGTMMESAQRFLPWIIATGIVLLIIGMISAWLTSRNITRPLDKLRQAAALMAAGKHIEPVEEDPGLELGELARAFNAMMLRVNAAQNSLEKTVEERTAQLHEANEELEAFSYSVSHDLRSPLRAVNSFAGILKQEYAPALGEDGNHVTDTIIASAARMSQLIDDLIRFSRLSKIPVQQQLIHMNELVQSCMQDLLREAPAGKYHVDIHPMPDCIGDPGLIRQVWLNLIGNAIKYSAKKDSPHIEIGSQNGYAPAAYFVRDNGAGFDMQYADKLFGVFQRLHHETEFEGVGIGLSLVKRIVQRHQGTVRAEATVGEGAAFYFTIPTESSVA